MLSRVVSGGVFGVDAYRVDVEVDVARGLPSFSVVGLPDGAVKESRDRVRAAIKNSGFAFPQYRVTVNLAPADVKKEGAAFDLPVALALLAADPDAAFSPDKTLLVAGELSLDGRVRPIKGALVLAAKARELGLAGVILPAENCAEASLVRGIDIYKASSLAQVVTDIKGGLLPLYEEGPKKVEEDCFSTDFAEVKGQGHAKRALEVAAAGGHNLLMVGPPGSGKTMLARRVTTILPKMGWEESVESSCIYSVAGLLTSERPYIYERPFRAPHHSVSDAGLVGGGVSPKPGEVTLAHNGVLFLDELPEFKRNVLELLRQPLEDGVVTIARASGSALFPARVMLVGAMNPCPCGYLGDERVHCTCSPTAVERYRSRISGPLLDRFDIRVEVGAVRYGELSSSADNETPSSTMRARVELARGIQSERFTSRGFFTNARMEPADIRKFCRLDASSSALLEHAMEVMHLSARGYTRTLKVARTIADLGGSKGVGREHLLEALQLRGPLGEDGNL